MNFQILVKCANLHHQFGETNVMVSLTEAPIDLSVTQMSCSIIIEALFPDLLVAICILYTVYS
jgi:hypothetical protein